MGQSQTAIRTSLERAEVGDMLSKSLVSSIIFPNRKR